MASRRSRRRRLVAVRARGPAARPAPPVDRPGSELRPPARARCSAPPFARTCNASSARRPTTAAHDRRADLGTSPPGARSTREGSPRRPRGCGVDGRGVTEQRGHRRLNCLTSGAAPPRLGEGRPRIEPTRSPASTSSAPSRSTSAAPSSERPGQLRGAAVAGGGVGTADHRGRVASIDCGLDAAHEAAVHHIVVGSVTALDADQTCRHSRARSASSLASAVLLAADGKQVAVGVELAEVARVPALDRQRDEVGDRADHPRAQGACQ